ncbi:Sugar ABC transporter, ATP-binding protein [[Mycoplasma] cavipharyngis]|uniref:ATP-binding cassette domain-containing protein n=1 Tax=[Mycoplasma] cavipharyngis TaxID=92757 RepID=UPI0037045F7A
MKQINSNQESKKPAIVIKNLYVKFNQKIILENLNLEIYENSLTSLLGSSGVGKTTLINAMIGLLKPHQGTVSYTNPSWKSNLGFVFQDALLYDEISVYKNIYLSIKNSYDWNASKKLALIKNFFDQKTAKQDSKNDDQKLNYLNKIYQKLINAYNNYQPLMKIKWLLLLLKLSVWRVWGIKDLIDFVQKINLKKFIKQEIINLAENLKISHILKNRANEISGGQKQRVAIAKALIKNSKIIFMDEPFSSLDADTKTQARDWLRETQKKYQLTILMVTHDQHDAVLISDYIIYLSNRQIQQYDHPHVFFEKPYNLEIAEFIGYPKINFLKEVNGIKHYLRPKEIKLKLNKNGKYKITNIINTGNYIIYEIAHLINNLQLRVFSNDSHYHLNDIVDINYASNAIIKFNQQGINLSYVEKVI